MLATLLSRTEWFARRPESELVQLARDCRLVELDRDETLYVSGASPTAFFILLDGRVGAWRDAPVESESMLYFIADEPGTTLCLENVIADIPYFATMRSLDRGGRLLAIPDSVLWKALDRDPALALDVARHVSRRLQAFTEQMTDLATLTVARRVAKYLVGRTDPVTAVATLPVSQADLASRLGASRQSVSTALATFAQRRLIVPLGRGSYQVLDLESLRSLPCQPARHPL